MIKARNILIFLIAGTLFSLCMSCFGDDSQFEKIHPASDPSNAGGWVLKQDMSDEFEGDRIDAAKWYVEGTDGKYKRWIGRAPSQFSAKNVRLQNGKLYRAGPSLLKTPGALLI